jgi:opacity protein-like surface antigen
MFRKIVLLATIGMMMMGFKAYAQQEWDLFAIGGFTRSTLTGGSDKLLGNEARSGFAGGIGLQLRMADYYGFELGLRYARTGGGGVIDSSFAIVATRRLTKPIGNADVNLDYVELPLTFLFLIDVNEASYFRAYIGPSLNILIRAHFSGVVDGQTVQENIKDSMQTSQVTILFGGSFVYNFKSFTAIADARYSQSVTAMTTGPDIKSKVFAATLGIGIPLARGE